MSPTWMSALRRHEAQLAAGRPAPAPKSTLRTPLRSTLTGTAWSLSVISVTSAMCGNTRVTWPTTPSSSITASPGSMPAVGALSTKSFCANGSRPA